MAFFPGARRSVVLYCAAALCAFLLQALAPADGRGCGGEACLEVVSLLRMGSSPDPEDLEDPEDQRGQKDRMDWRDYLPDAEGGKYRQPDTEAWNISDWMRRLPGCGKEDVAAFVYRWSRERIMRLREKVKSGQADDGKADGPVEKYILRHGDGALLDYLLLVRDTRRIFREKDPWEYSAPDAAENVRLTRAAEKEADGRNGEFLQLRYAFQALRLNLAQGDHERVIDFFERLVEPLTTTSEVKEWCRSFYAGSLYRAGRHEEAFLHFARVAEASARYRNAALRGCRWAYAALRDSFASPDLLREYMLKRARTVPERQNLLLALALAEYGEGESASAVSLAALLEAAGQDAPVPAGAAGLLLRLVRGLELEQTSFDPLSPDPYNIPRRGLLVSASPKGLDAAMRRLDAALPGLGDTGENPEFWGILSTYLAFFNRDAEAVRRRAARLEARAASDWSRRQLLALRLAADAAYAPLTPETEASIAAGMAELVAPPCRADDAAATGEDAGEDSSARGPDAAAAWRSIAHDILACLLAQRYHDQGRPDRAAMCLAAAEALLPRGRWSEDRLFWYLDALDRPWLAKIHAVALRPETAFERLLAFGVTRLMPDGKSWNELDAVKLMRRLDFAGAERVLAGGFADLPPVVWAGESQIDAERNWGFVDGHDLSSQYDEDYLGTPRAAFGPAETRDGDSGTDGGLFEKVESRFGWREILGRISEAGEKGGRKTVSLTDGSVLRRSEVAAMIATLESVSSRHGFVTSMRILRQLSGLPGEEGVRVRYLYAVGLYNISHYGNSCRFTEWREADWFTKDYYTVLERAGEGRPKQPSWRAADDALREFLAVAAATSDHELQARCYFLASLCLQGTVSYLEDADYSHATLGGAYFRDNPYFTTLVRHYLDTDVYRAASGACSYLRDFDAVRRRLGLPRESAPEARP